MSFSARTCSTTAYTHDFKREKLYYMPVSHRVHVVQEKAIYLQINAVLHVLHASLDVVQENPFKYQCLYALYDMYYMY